MPAADQKTSVHPEAAAFMVRMRPRQEGGLEQEIAALRSEIRELREALEPVPSLILTGREVLDEFKRLNALA